MTEKEGKSLITRPAVYQVLREYWEQYKRWPVFSLVLFLVPSIATIFVSFIPPLIIAEIVNVLTEKGTMALSSAWIYILAFGGLWIVGELLWRLSEHVLIRVEEKSMNALYRSAYSKITNMDYKFFTDNFVGTLTKRISGFGRGFEGLTEALVFNTLPNVLPVIFVAVVLWGYSPWITIILFGWIIFGILVGIPILRRRAKLLSERQEAGSKLMGRLSDSLTNIFTVKSFAKEKWELEKFGHAVDDFTNKYKKAADHRNLRFYTLMSPIYVLSNVTGIIAAIFFMNLLSLQVGTLVVIFSYYSTVTIILWRFIFVYQGIEFSVSEAAEFTQMLLEPPAVQDKPDAKELVASSSVVEFENVGFKYAGKKDDRELFLKDFNLKINKNEKVGLVGPSGGGKTTITKLILRFLDVEEGRIAIDGQDISEVTQKSLREVVSYVPQEPLLFHRSLFDNIAYGKDGATEEEVIRAAKLARADEFISVLPDGYKTMVGERGVKLSGGQRQRVAIARAILKDAPILVLDEATSSLDSESEKYIQEGLWELMKDKTALVIAHRLSTIKHLDRIIVLENGKIVQDGTHEELINKKGLYAKLWSHQSGEFLAE